MGLFSKSEAKPATIDTVTVNYEPYVPTDLKEVANITGITQAKAGFKGEVENKEKKFPVDLGEEHPYPFAITEGLYRKYGLVTGVVDKYIDFIVGPGFHVTSEEDNGDKAVQIIEDFMRDVNFDTLLRAWIKEALLKGNGFLEIGGKEDDAPKGLKCLNANYMYVKRDKFGVIEGYNQYTGGFNRFEKKKINPFKPHQIAHLPINLVADDAYGLGVIYPGVITINNLIKNEKDLHMLMGRKANAPLQIKMGGVVGGKYYKPNKVDIDRFGKDTEWLNNKHEWATDGLTEMKVVDFGNIGEKFDTVLNHDISMLVATFQIPEVLWGKAVNLATAPVQMDAFERRVRSLQQQVEKVVENDLFKRVLLANGLDIHVEFNWGKLSTIERDARITKLTEIVNSQTTSESLKTLAERELVALMELDETEFVMLSEEEEKRREVERQQPIVPGQNANPPAANQSLGHIHTEDCDCAHTESNKSYTLQEWLGFNYKDYIKQIGLFIDEYEFDNLIAKTAVEAQAGKLTTAQITKLKRIMKNGFKKGNSLEVMSKQIDRAVKPKDLLKVVDNKIITKNGSPVLVRSAAKRSMSIIRTETTKVANEGAKKQYKEGGVTHIRWVSSFGARTCPECEALNGEVFPIDGHPAIPLHGMCRCTIVPVTELG